MPEPVKPATPAKLPTITVTLDPQFHAYVIQAAKDDYDRPPSRWLKRLIQEQLAEIISKD